MKYTIKQIAVMYGVTTMGVRYWIGKGLKTETEKVIGIKPRMVIDPQDVDEFLKVTNKEGR